MVKQAALSDEDEKNEKKDTFFPRKVKKRKFMTKNNKKMTKYKNIYCVCGRTPSNSKSFILPIIQSICNLFHKNLF